MTMTSEPTPPRVDEPEPNTQVVTGLTREALLWGIGGRPIPSDMDVFQTAVARVHPGLPVVTIITNDKWITRYRTAAEANAGHERIVEELRAGGSPEQSEGEG